MEKQKQREDKIQLKHETLQALAAREREKQEKTEAYKRDNRVFNDMAAEREQEMNKQL